MENRAEFEKVGSKRNKATKFDFMKLIKKMSFSYEEVQKI